MIDGKKKFCVLLLLCMFSVTVLSGCTTLRRKFVRKSKAKDAQSELVPVLEPEVYKPAVYSPAESYRSSYSIYRAYLKDVWDVLGKGEGDKRERYILLQVVSKLKVMAGLLKPEKASALDSISNEILAMVKELDKPSAIRRYDIMKKDFRAIEDRVRREFKPDAVQAFLREPEKK